MTTMVERFKELWSVAKPEERQEIAQLMFHRYAPLVEPIIKDYLKREYIKVKERKWREG